MGHLVTILTKKVKNLLPPFTRWTLHANASVIEPYKLKLDATGTGQASSIIVPCIPISSYFASMEGGNFRIDQKNKDGTTNILRDYSPSLANFTTGEDAAYLTMYVLGLSSTGTFILTNPQLELSTIATPFEPQ